MNRISQKMKIHYISYIDLIEEIILLGILLSKLAASFVHAAIRIYQIWLFLIDLIHIYIYVKDIHRKMKLFLISWRLSDSTS